MDETKTKLESERLGLPSASGSERLYQCAGSWNAEQLIPVAEASSVVAEEGDEVHEAMVTGDTSSLGMTTAEIAKALAELEHRILEDWATSRAGIPAIETTHSEKRYWLRDESGKKVTSAKLDRLHIWDDDALIIDWKTGYKTVKSASENWQVRVQAMVVAQNFTKVKRIRVVLAQHRFKTSVTAADYDMADIDLAMEDWRLALWRSRQPDAQRVAGHWCQYCRAKAHCVQAAAYALVPTVMWKVAELSDEAAAELRRKKALIEIILKDVDNRLKALPPERLAELGWELSEPGHTTTIKDPIKAFNLLYDQGVINEPEFMLACKPSVVKLRDITLPRIMTKYGMRKMEAMESFQNILGDQIEKKPKQASLKEIT